MESFWNIPNAAHMIRFFCPPYFCLPSPPFPFLRFLCLAAANHLLCGSSRLCGAFFCVFNPYQLCAFHLRYDAGNAK